MSPLERADTAIQTTLDVTERPDWTEVIMQASRTGWTPEVVFEIWGVWYVVAFAFAIVCTLGIGYCVLRILQIRRIEYANFHKHAHTVAADDVPRTRLRWNRIMEHAQSDEEHKWRLAILEADIMLNELLDLQGYKGETMAEKMKQVNRANFNTIDDAWDAHKVRNRVAHEGVEHPLSEQEKNRVMGLYARVFREFKFI